MNDESAPKGAPESPATKTDASVRPPDDRSRVRHLTCPPKWELDVYLAEVTIDEPADDPGVGTPDPDVRPHLPATVPDDDWLAYVEHVTLAGRI